MILQRKHKILRIAVLTLVLTVGLSVPLHQSHAAGALDVAWNIFYNLITLRSLVGLLFTGLAKLLTYVLGQLGNIPPEVTEIWKIVRNFANLFFILALIIMAFGTIFDIEHYSFKKMFVPFLIAALLINFSLPIGVYLINLSTGITNVFSNTISEAMYGDVAHPAKAIVDTVTKGLAVKAAGLPDPGTKPPGTTFKDVKEALGKLPEFGRCVLNPFSCLARWSTDLLFSITYLVLALFVILFIFLYLLARTPILWVLLIVSPIAWLGLALPNLKKNLWNRWWEWFISWTFSVPVYFFILMLLAIILKGEVEGTETGTVGGVYFVVTLIFTIAGIWASFKVGKLFKGGAGWAAGVAQNAVKAIPIPKGRNEAGKMVFTSIADQERGAKQTWKRFVQQGPPEKGPLGWMRNFYTGTRGQEQGGKEAAKFMQERVLGYGPDVEAEKEKLKDLDHEVTILENKIDIGEIKPEMDEIKEEIRLARGNLFTALGSIDTHMLANYMTLAKKGDLDEKQTREVLRTLTATDPLLAKKFMETATKSNLQNLDTLQKLNVGVELKDKEGIIQPAMLQGPKAQAAQKEYYRWMISEEGQKFTRKIKPEDAIEYDALQKNFNQGMKIFGGQTTNEGKGFLKAWANAHPEMVVDYIASNRDGKTKSEDLNAEKLWRDYLPTDLKVVADLPQNVWNNPDFQAAFTEKRLKGRDVAGLNRIAQLMAEYITDDKKQAAFSQLLKAARDIAESTKKTAEAAAETAEGGGTSGRPRVPIIDTFDEFGRKL